MREYAIKGGAPLVGEVEIGGAKNAALGILAGALLSNETVEIENVPDLYDTNVMMDALKELGAYVEKVDRHTVRINGAGVHKTELDNDDLKKIRGSYYFAGSLLGKCQNRSSRRMQYRIKTRGSAHKRLQCFRRLSSD